MKWYKKRLIWATRRLGGLCLIRYLVNILEIARNANERLAFPFVKRRRNAVTQILVYHRVNDEDDPIFPGVPTKIFAQQMEYLAEHYSVCALTELVQRLETDDLPADTVTITFDDGYRDNYTNAFPILKRVGLPATVFLTTDAIGTGRLLWHDRVFAAFRASEVPALHGWGNNKGFYPLHSAAEKSATLDQCLKILWSLDDEVRSVWTDELIARLSVGEQQVDHQLMLSWNDVREMSGENIEFGAHTVSHPILSKVSARRARDEIVNSKQLIESNLKLAVRHFAYPVGRAVDFSPEIKDLLREAGFRSAVTTISGVNGSDRDVFELRRATPWDQNIDLFAFRLSYFKFLS